MEDKNRQNINRSGSQTEDSSSWVVQFFKENLSKDSELAPAVAGVNTLTQVIKQSKATTMMELEIELKKAADILKTCSNVLSVSSGCELFTRFVTRTSLDIPDFVECKKILIERGQQYTQQSSLSRIKIGQLANNFLRDGTTVLTHGLSRVVLSILLQAHDKGKRFSVLVTESRTADEVNVETTNKKLQETARRLQEHGIPVTLVTDVAVAHYMEKVDMIIVGAEGIVENGGIINKIGTYQIAIVAAAFNKPFYVAAESFKFMRFFPLTQRDLSSLKINESKNVTNEDANNSKKIKIWNPLNDYTPPSFITLLFTELGVLTPSAVSDELIKLYY